MQRERKAVSLMLGPAEGGGATVGTAAILQGLQWRTAGASDE